MSELSEQELDRRVTELLGWKVARVAVSMGAAYVRCKHADCTGDAAASLHHPHLDIPEYHTDLNAVFRDVVPFAEARGFAMEYRGAFRPTGPVHAIFTPQAVDSWNRLPDYGASADYPATAICRAFVALATGQGWAVKHD